MDAFNRSKPTEGFRLSNCQKSPCPVGVTQVYLLQPVYEQDNWELRWQGIPVALPTSWIASGKAGKGLGTGPSTLQINKPATFCYDLWTCPKRENVRDHEHPKNIYIFPKTFFWSLTTQAAAGQLLSLSLWAGNGSMLLFCPAEGRHKGWCAGGTWGSGYSPHIFLCSSEEWQHKENKKEKLPRERISKDSGILWRQKIFFNKYLYRILPLCESEITVHFIPLVLVCSWRPFS